MTITKVVLGTSLVWLFAGPTAIAQDRKAEQAIKHRRAAFVLMSTYFSRLLQTVEGDRPFDPILVAKDAKLVEELSRLPWEGFAPGTERGDTRAKEEVWLDDEQFKRLTVELQARTSDLSKVAAGGNLARLKVAFEQTRDVCNACHKDFRKK
ncbi:cytochrome c556 [Burkholderiales bacterium JOSHI_001]|nr:cytochrome c556 [Burkholderiales bacterium JOSHI_001]